MTSIGMQESMFEMDMDSLTDIFETLESSQAVKTSAQQQEVLKNEKNEKSSDSLNRLVKPANNLSQSPKIKSIVTHINTGFKFEDYAQRQKDAIKKAFLNKTK